MLFVLPTIFATDTKTIYGYNFVAPLKQMLLFITLGKFELNFPIIRGIRTYVDMRLNRKLSSVIFYCGLTVRTAWLIERFDRLIMARPFTEKKCCVTE